MASAREKLYLQLFADDLQQTGEAKEIGSHLNDDLQNLLKYGIGFP